MQSNTGVIGWTPSVGMLPSVPFNAYSAALVPGCTREPSLSVAMANTANPAATPTAGPAEDPAGV